MSNDVYIDVRVLNDSKTLTVRIYRAVSSEDWVTKPNIDDALIYEGSFTRDTINPLLLKLMTLIDMGEDGTMKSQGDVRRVYGLGARYKHDTEGTSAYYIHNVRVRDMHNAHESTTIDHPSFER